MTADSLAIPFSAMTAIAFGTSDFLGGVVSSRLDPRFVACVLNVITALLIAPIAWATGSALTSGGWVAALGAGSIEAVGSVALFRGLSQGRMGVVAPIAGIVNAMVPMVVGLCRGESHSPIAWFGLLLAAPAIVLMTTTPEDSDRPSGWLYGVVAGIGFGTGFAVLGSMPAHASLATLGLTQTVAAGLLGLTCVAARVRVPRTRAPQAWWLLGAGLIGGTGLASFQIAARGGHLGESAVISSFYPAMTVLLAAVILRERLFRVQVLGFVVCAASVGLVVVG